MSEEEFPPRLRLAVQRLSRRLTQRARGGLTASQLSMLVTVEKEGPLRLGDLAAVEEIPPPSVTRQVETLMEQDLVIRREDPEDRRSGLVEITASGRELLERSRAQANEMLRSSLAGLDSEALQRLWAALPVLEDLAAGPQPPIHHGHGGA